jgi:hypothetical protein
MVSADVIADLKKTLIAERGRDVSDQEVQDVVDYLYALADLIFEGWEAKQVETRNNLNHNHDDDNTTGI